MILQVLLQFCNNSGFSAMFDVVMLFCPLLDYWIDYYAGQGDEAWNVVL